jgi:hypothetical protein
MEYFQYEEIEERKRRGIDAMIELEAPLSTVSYCLRSGNCANILPNWQLQLNKLQYRHLALSRVETIHFL